MIHTQTLLIHHDNNVYFLFFYIKIFFILSSPNRTIERVFEPEDSFKVAEGIKVKLKGCNNHLLPQPKFCPACGRGDQKSKRILPMAKIEVDAPRSIAVLRDDIKEKQ